MTTSLNSLTDVAKTYNKLTDVQKADFLQQAYNGERLSYSEIANLVGTYTKAISRDAKRLGIQSRDKSDAQKEALKSGRREHPMKGKKHNTDSRIKISESLASNWEELPVEEREQRALKAKEQWEARTPQEKNEFHRLSYQAIHKAAKSGSKLELFLHQVLIKAGYKTIFHREHLIINEKMHLDFVLPEHNIIIEVDGPTHYRNVYGEESFEKTKKADNQKDGLLLGRGFSVIRVQHEGGLTEKYKRDISTLLLKTIETIKQNKKPTKVILEN